LPSIRSHRPTYRAAFLVVALVLAAGVAALGALSAARQVEGFQPVGFTAVAEGAVWRVAAVDEPATGLEPGDRIALVEGREAASLRGLEGELRSRADSRLLVGRGGEVVEVLYRRPGVEVDWSYLVLALVGAAYLLIGLYTTLKDRTGRSRLFFLWCLASAAFYLLTPGRLFDDAGRVLYVADMLARLLLPPLTLHLFLVFPSVFGRARRTLRTVPFLYLPAAFLLLVQADLLATGGRLLLGGPAGVRGSLGLLDRIEVAHLVVFALAAVAVLARRWMRYRDWEQLRQVQWVTVGFAAGYLPFVAFYALPHLAGLDWPAPIEAAALAPLAVVPLTFAWAILRYKLWDIDVIVRDTISYTVTLLLGVIGFSLANLAIGRGAFAEMPLLRNVLVFAAGLSIAGVLVPAKRAISTGLERIQYRGTYGKRRELVTFARDLLHERDLDRLCSRLLDALEEAVDLERANLYLVQNEETLRGAGLVPVRPEPTLPARLPLDVLGDDVWDAEVRELGGVALPTPESLPAQRLYAAGYRYALPLVVRGHRVGLALTGYRRGRQRLSSDDLELIRQLLDQAALGIENAQLLDQLQHRLDEVTRLQQYNEGIIESSPAGIAVLDAAKRIVSANLGFAALAGRERAKVLGRPLGDLLPVGTLPEPGTGPLEVSYCEPDGRERHLQLSSASFDRGEGTILVVHDVSEQVAMQAALKEKDRLAALGVMAAGVAHEVNTPLTGISSYAQMLLAETAVDDPRYEVLRKVERQTFRAARIVNGLLDFARNRQNEHGPVDLGAVVGECLDLLRERLESSGVRVESHGLADGVRVRGDEGEIQQVVTNLLLNAYDAMAGGGGRLDLELASRDGRARLTVSDTGCGIPPEVVGRVFEPFVTTKLGQGGTGLGLAISHDIVRHHGGDLSVESEPGRGARFTLELPLERTTPGA